MLNQHITYRDYREKLEAYLRIILLIVRIVYYLILIWLLF